MLKDRQRVPDGVINLSGAVDHIIRRIECLKLQRFAFRSSMPLVVTRLVEDAALASEVQAPRVEDEQQIRHDLEARLADAIVQARLLQLTNEDHGFNCPQDALNRAFSSVYLDALRSQLCTVAYHIRQARNLTLVADIDLSSCSVLSGPLAINSFVDDDLGEHTVSDEKTTRWINLRDILHRLEKNDDENQYDEEDWREWWDNKEPPFEKDN